MLKHNQKNHLEKTFRISKFDRGLPGIGKAWTNERKI